MIFQKVVGCLKQSGRGSWIILFLLASSHVWGQKKLVVTATTPDFYNGAKVTLTASFPFNAIFDYKTIRQSTIVSRKCFGFTLESDGPELYHLQIELKNGKLLREVLFLEPGIIHLDIKDTLLKEISVRGSKAAKEYKTFMQLTVVPELILRLRSQRDSLSEKMDTSILPLIKKELITQNAVMLKVWAGQAITWIRTHPDAHINPFLIKRFIEEHYPDDTLKALYPLLSPVSLSSSYGRELRYYMENLSIGARLPAFKAIDKTGEIVRLPPFTDQMVLVDFWASWCVPCREGHPELIKIYELFKPNGFTIISISIDEKEENWKEAIAKDKLTWPQLIDLKTKDNSGKALGVKSLPSNYLINSQGKIIAKNITVLELNALLKEKL